jgi:hypothetical protein
MLNTVNGPRINASRKKPAAAEPLRKPRNSRNAREPCNPRDRRYSSAIAAFV